VKTHTAAQTFATPSILPSALKRRSSRSRRKPVFLATVPGVEAGQVADKKDKDLLTLAEETGGTAFFTGDMLSLERSFTKISKELRAQYLVTYNPTNKSYDGTFRKIDVKLSDGHGDLKVRTKRGYKAIADSVVQ
jgi:VWFA-related protein